MAHLLEQERTYEVEYTSTAEGELHERRKMCKKNPKHKAFIPLKKFTQNDLPSEYQTEEVVTIIKAIADLTVRIRAPYTSMSRPLTFPETDCEYTAANFRGCSLVRVGTGFIGDIRIIENGQEEGAGLKHCPCYSCRLQTNNPHLTWGQVSIITAAHVVCTPDEVVHAEIDCFYEDDPVEEDKNKNKLYGNSMRGSKNPITKVDLLDDFCQFTVITHDTDLCRKLSQYNMFDLLTMDLGIDSSTNSSLTIVVSHPHGCPKCVSCGRWELCETLNKKDEPSKSRYYYNTPTCRGSSGALVWLLEPSQKKWQKIYVHSGSLHSGLNYGGAVDMFSEFITNAVQCHIS
uniref:Peptidase S1 domain-containing protein n=1 Tax=Arion vulgaris TaxID=1028688 RepID=A0A0B6YTG8_9EUPU